MGFEGYPTGMSLLPQIGAASKDEFAALKARWHAELLEPTKALVEGLGPMLRSRVSPSLQWAARTGGSVSPITNDVRFAAPGTPPYKDYLMLTYWDGLHKKTSPTIRIRYGDDGAGYSIGMAFTPPQLARFREAVLTEAGPALVEAVESAGIGMAETGALPAELKRPAVRVPDDSPVRHLLTHKTYWPWWHSGELPPYESAAFATWLADLVGRGADVHQWFVDHVYRGETL